MVSDKRELERALKPLSKPRSLGLYKRELEQYPTPTSTASHMAWIIRMKNKLVNKTILDMGCGSGVLSIASLLAGSSRVICLDIDEDILLSAGNLVSSYYGELSHRVILVNGDALNTFFSNVDTVVMNPPFGVIERNRGLDVQFLEKALLNARYVFSLHKFSNGLVEIIKDIANSRRLEIIWFEILELEIPMLYPRHRRKVHRIKALFIGLEKGGG
ncbi:MAG: methyltransferase [Desulfurococcaceae archaeon]